MSVTNTTYSPFGPDNAFCPGDDGFRIYDDHAYYTYKRWRDADDSYWECREVGREEAERNKFNALMVGCSFTILFFPVIF